MAPGLSHCHVSCHQALASRLQYTIFPNIASSQKDLTGTIVRSFWLRTGDKIHYNSASVVSIMVIMIIINKQKGFRIWITMVIHIFWTWLFICIITSQHWLLHILNGDGWWLWSDVRAILEPWTLNDYNYYGRIIISFEINCGEICIFSDMIHILLGLMSLGCHQRKLFLEYLCC